ncbi:uncharacterized protein KIAA0754-like [Astatotilapia calliptera]|uniref:uncharacterized protein KIAA0754-like n=1 Tax=Astatotilapia calliptera TaxID=8154 RepID=UPI000E41A50D|nr:uncharacterized protein KIAA0754-like [Astatotilapia calliptera]
MAVLYRKLIVLFLTLYSGAECFVTGDGTPSDFPTLPAPCLSVQPVQTSIQLAAQQPLAQSASQPPSQLASLQPLWQSIEQSVAQLIAQSQSSLAPLQEAVPTPPILDCFSSAHLEQRDKHINTDIFPHELASFQTVTCSRASPEAELQPSPDSGPLEAKKPVEDCTRLSLPEQGQCSAQLQSSLCVPGAHVPTGFALCVPETHKPAGFVSCVPEAHVPAGSVTVFSEGSEELPQPAAFAGGAEEPVQPPPSAPTPSPAAPPPAAPTLLPAAPPPAARTPGPASVPSSSSGPASAPSSTSTPAASASSPPAAHVVAGQAPQSPPACSVSLIHACSLIHSVSISLIPHR